jgi:hypothetical protein
VVIWATIGQERVQLSAQDTHSTLTHPNGSQLTAIDHGPDHLIVQAQCLRDLAHRQVLVEDVNRVSVSSVDIH